MAEKMNKKANSGGKLPCEKEKFFEREKSQCLRQKLQKMVIQTLVKKDENEESASEEDAKLEIPNEIGISLNLSKRNLEEFPNKLLDKVQNVQYLYLESSKLTELPETFFEKLPLLKWLDLRNNFLTSLPTLGLKNHSSLEVILLQGNKIRNLPIELATIPSLKGIQTADNPLTNVPYDCIAQGFPGIMNHLRKLCSQNDILVPGSQSVTVKSASNQENMEDKLDEIMVNTTDLESKFWDLEKLSQWRHFIKKKSKAPTSDLKYFASRSEKHTLQKPKMSIAIRTRPKAPFKAIPFKCGVYHKNKQKSVAFALHYLQMRKTRLGYKKNPITAAIIEEKARKEAYAAQVRETLEKQARKIQRLRDKEVLKAWRDHARLTKFQMKMLDNYQSYPSKDFVDKTPFDVDPEFLSMLNRADIYRSLRDYDLRSKKVKKPKIKISALDLERQMNEIIEKLKNLGTSEMEESSPRTKESHMCNKMSKILDIQKTLKHLQTLNSSMAGITPLGASKNINKREKTKILK